MAEGMILGGIISSVTDMARIYRFSRAFQKADDLEKQAIVRALNREAEEIGGGLAKLQEIADNTAECVLLRRAMVAQTRPGCADGFNYQLLDMELDKVNSAREPDPVHGGDAGQSVSSAEKGSALATQSDRWSPGVQLAGLSG